MDTSPITFIVAYHPYQKGRELDLFQKGEGTHAELPGVHSQVKPFWIR